MRRTLHVLLALAVATGVTIGARLCATEPANATTAPLLGGVWDASDNPIDDVQVVLYSLNPNSATNWDVESLSPGATFRVDRALSPFGTTGSCRLEPALSGRTFSPSASIACAS